MKRYRTTITRLAGFFIAASAIASAAQGPASGQTPAPQTQPVPYRPGMGDFMAAGVQPRHTKLAAAGQAGNWAYAAYALKELIENFNRLARTTPIYQGMPTAELIEGAVKGPMAAVGEAIKAGDPVRFKAAYSELTQGCNSCHVKTDRAEVVIQVPNVATAYPDENFQPAK
jgi:hypothetical protein